MNATLQCFCHIQKFVEYFKYKQDIKFAVKNKNLLSYSFKILIEELWPDDYNSSKIKKSYSPEEFKQKISKMNPLFKGIAANDAKDLVNFIIMTLHSELNALKDSEDINNNGGEIGLIDQSNKNLVFQYYFNDFKSKNKSIISDLFYATNCSISECSNCHVKIYNYQTYFFIIFPLEEVRKYKNQFNQFNQFPNFNFNNINNYNNEVSIYDCFDYDRKINSMSGENSMYCNYCKSTCDFYMNTNLVTGPNVLIILLNRGKGKEFDVKINFFESIFINNYIEFSEYEEFYELIGVITHIGESSMSGHFIAYCKDPIINKWNKYNDSIVTEVNNFQNEVINFAMPYLLFYRKKNN